MRFFFFLMKFFFITRFIYFLFILFIYYYFFLFRDLFGPSWTELNKKGNFLFKNINLVYFLKNIFLNGNFILKFTIFDLLWNKNLLLFSKHELLTFNKKKYAFSIWFLFFQIIRLKEEKCHLNKRMSQAGGKPGDLNCYNWQRKK